MTSVNSVIYSAQFSQEVSIDGQILMVRFEELVKKEGAIDAKIKAVLFALLEAISLLPGSNVNPTSSVCEQVNALISSLGDLMSQLDAVDYEIGTVVIDLTIKPKPNHPEIDALRKAAEMRLHKHLIAQKIEDMKILENFRAAAGQLLGNRIFGATVAF